MAYFHVSMATVFPVESIACTILFFTSNEKSSREKDTDCSISSSFFIFLNLSESCVDVFAIHDSSIKPSVEFFVHYIAEDTVSVTLYQCLKRTFLGNDWDGLHLLKFRLFIPYNVSPVISLK